MKNLNATLVVAITAASSFASTSNAFLPVHTAVVEPAVVKAGRRRRCIDTNICPHHHAVQGGGVDDNSRFTTSSSSSTPSLSIIIQKAKLFASKQFFPLGMVVAVTFAKRFPWLGKNGSILHPELFIGQYGVATIFLLSGLSLRLSELSDAISNVSLNMAIQFATFVVWPFCIGLPLTKALGSFNNNFLLPRPLLDGLLILTCLPTTINMCVVLTSTSGGNVACSLCNAVTSNVAGIFITPALLILFLGKQEINLPFLDMVNKLCGKVVLPVGESKNRTGRVIW
jgi:sodium/bile acid cotransporter 7